jgi:hypothetical protein
VNAVTPSGHNSGDIPALNVTLLGCRPLVG